MRLLGSDLVNLVTDAIPSASTAKIMRAANLVLLRVHNELTLPEYGTFTTRAKVTTGTVSVAAGSTTAEFSGTPIATTDPFSLIQIEGDDAWFTLTPVDTNTGTLGSAWATTTDATATYTLVFPTVSFPKAVGGVLRIWRDGEADLFFAGDRGAAFAPAALGPTGTPTYWSPYLHDSAAASPSDDLVRLLLSPAPESAEVLSYSYRRRPTLLVESGGTVLTQAVPLPDAYNEVVYAGILFWFWNQRDRGGQGEYWRGVYENAFRRVKGYVQPSTMVQSHNARRLRGGGTMNSPIPTEA